MPNYCFNSLHVEGPPEDVERFFTENKGAKQVLSFEKSFPVPEGAEYWWRIQNWGCKWDCDIDGTELEDIDHDDDLNWVTYNFSTPNSPPDLWLQAVAKKYHTLKFVMDSEEGGNDYYAKFTAQGDEFLESNYTPFEWYYENYEDFSLECDRIKIMPYEEFLKEFSEGGLVKLLEESPSSLLEPIVLARIKDEHLPMFVGIEWLNEEDNFARRMAGQPAKEEV